MDFNSIIARWQTRKSLTGFGVDQFLALVDTMANRPMTQDVLIMHPDMFKLFYPDEPMIAESTPSEPGVFFSLWEDIVTGLPNDSDSRAGLTEILTAPAPELIPITGKDLHPNDFRDLWEYMTGGGQ
jgi:hypothetical protein